MTLTEAICFEDKNSNWRIPLLSASLPQFKSENLMNTKESSICDIFLNFVFGIFQLFHSEISQKIILLPKIQIRFHEDLGPHCAIHSLWCHAIYLEELIDDVTEWIWLWVSSQFMMCAHEQSHLLLMCVIMFNSVAEFQRQSQYIC